MSPISPEQKEELMREIAANRARQEAITRVERFEAGEFAIELVAEPNEPAADDASFQAELREFGRTLSQANVDHSQLAIAFDSVESMGYPLPEFVVGLQALATPAALSALSGALGAWLQARYGRKVRLKIGDIEAEGRSLAEVEKLLALAAKFKDAHPDLGAHISKEDSGD
jgi:hypothetical protein